MNSVHERLRYARETIVGVSLREFQAAINSGLDPSAELSLGTISNYERPPSSTGVRAGPRIEFLSALRAAFPEIRIEWIVFGEGQPTRVGERLVSPEGLDAGAAGDGFAARVLERYPDLDLLAPESSALFMAALTRLAMGEPEMALDEERLLGLAGDLRWLMLLPVRFWGFRHDPPYEVFSRYSVAALNALMQLMPPPGQGDPTGDYAASPGPELRNRFHVGF